MNLYSKSNNKNLFYLFSTITAFTSSILIAYYCNSVSGETIHIQDEINRKLEDIHNHYQDNQDYKVCKESKETEILIRSNLTNLKKSEPYHNWQEIHNITLDLIKRHCSRT